MTFGAPQIIHAPLMLISVGICLARYGEPKRGTYDFVDVFLAPCIGIALLWWGGFYG